MERYVFSKKQSLELWTAESKRFKTIYDYIPEYELWKVCNTSPFRRRVRDYVPCMIIWLKAGQKYFESISDRHSDQKPFDINDVTEYTNTELKNYPHTIKELWNILEESEESYRNSLARVNERTLLLVRSNWHWFVWTTFGHYSEHSLQLEHHCLGKTEKPPDDVWLNPLLK